jgi:DNA mismatch repair protein MutL
MPDIIQILPDSVANQIAAGEVIQRPASVVKELVENAVDSGATQIKVVIKDAGKTLVQIIDNGSGMSDTDARIAFERHATSKIRKADDLFAIETFGFRGEALASIAAIAQVELRTRRNEDEIGTLIRINGSDFEIQEGVSCSVGSIFSVKNLFYNVPARRRFLKADSVEFRHILDEIHRVALAHPEVAITLIHNDSEVYNLPQSLLKQRIVNLFGKNLSNELLSIQVETSIATIEGFIGKPEYARKKGGLQYFFVNQRYMRHPFLYRTLVNSYQSLLPPDTTPSFFVYFNTKPEFIDVNIHPTKTEIKFEDERAVSQILAAAVRQTLGKSNMIPSIDFDNEPLFDIPPIRKGQEFVEPEIEIDPTFNPFAPDKSDSFSFKFQSKSSNPSGWQDLYKVVEQSAENEKLFPDENNESAIVKEDVRRQCFHFKGKYILSQVKSGLMVIDQHRAHQRILFDEFSQALSSGKIATQNLVFPSKLDLNVQDSDLLRELLGDLIQLGFDIDEFGKNSFVVRGIPAGMQTNDIEKVIEQFLGVYQSLEKFPDNASNQRLLTALVDSGAISYGKNLSWEEMSHIIDMLFRSTNPNYSPSGKTIFTIINSDEIEKRLK